MDRPFPRLGAKISGNGILLPAVFHLEPICGNSNSSLEILRADQELSAGSRWHQIGLPALPPLDSGGHKYDRGLVHALAGAMPGAIALAAKAAALSGAGYVRVSTSRPIAGLPSAVVQIDRL